MYFILISWLAIDIFNSTQSKGWFAEVRPLTYSMQSAGIVILCIDMREYIVHLCHKLVWIDKLSMHFNKHAFSVLALIRLLVVVILTATVCIPMTFLHKRVAS